MKWEKTLQLLKRLLLGQLQLDPGTVWSTVLSECSHLWGVQWSLACHPAFKGQSWNRWYYANRGSNWFLYLFFFFFHFRDAPVAYGSSQARGQIGTAAARLYTTATATPDSSRICDLCCSLQQRWILNPLIKPRDWTCILMEICQVLNSWTGFFS